MQTVTPTSLVLLTATVTILFIGVMEHAEAKEKDWSAIANKVDQMRHVVLNAIKSINAIAQADNPQISDIIAGKLESARFKGQVIMEQMGVHIENKRLTEQQARGYLSRMHGGLPIFKADVKRDLQKLSDRARFEITDLFDVEMATLTELAQDFYALLRD